MTLFAYIGSCIRRNSLVVLWEAFAALNFYLLLTGGFHRLTLYSPARWLIMGLGVMLLVVGGISTCVRMTKYYDHGGQKPSLLKEAIAIMAGFTLISFGLSITSIILADIGLIPAMIGTMMLVDTMKQWEKKDDAACWNEEVPLPLARLTANFAVFAAGVGILAISMAF